MYVRRDCDDGFVARMEEILHGNMANHSDFWIGFFLWVVCMTAHPSPLPLIASGRLWGLRFSSRCLRHTITAGFTVEILYGRCLDFSASTSWGVVCVCCSLRTCRDYFCWPTAPPTHQEAQTNGPPSMFPHAPQIRVLL